MMGVSHADIATETGARAQHYQDIVRLNAFRLKPLPSTAPTPVPVTTNSLADLKLTGVATSAGRKSAYFLWEQRGTAPRYFSLGEGQKDGDLEAIAIDVVAETVWLRHQGVPMVRSLKANGVKSGTQIAFENRRFVDEHTRAHEAHQRRERERVERERAEAERFLHQQQPSNAFGVDTHQSIIPALSRSQEAFSAEFSPDGRRIVTTAPDGAARIWDAQTGKPLDGGAGEPNGVNP